MTQLKAEGQKAEKWTDHWKGVTIEGEIQMWDFFGGRPWILKYMPRNGKVIEAGCGLGRYNFYLSQLGVDITGIDFSKETIEFVNEWQKKNDYNVKFMHGDVLKLPYEDNSISGYLSLGVIEHFEEGPKQVLDEAYRVLKPGGIAVITTPNNSWRWRQRKFKRKLRNTVKKIIGRSVYKPPFFQYEYTPKQLKRFMKDSDLYPLEITGSDFLNSFVKPIETQGENIHPNSIPYKLAPYVDNSIFRNVGTQSITITTKLADKMQCFFCGEDTATPDSLKKYRVPVGKECENHQSAKHYLKSARTYYHQKYVMYSDIKPPTKETCSFCSAEYTSDKLFEDFGFNKMVCKDCLAKPDVSLQLCNENIKPIWRKMKIDRGTVKSSYQEK